MTDELQAAEVETYRVALAEGHSLLFHVCAEKCPVADSLVAYMAAIRATEAARYRGLVEAIETEHEEWHRQYDGTRNGVALPIAQCRNGLCAALAENPAPARPDEARCKVSVKRSYGYSQCVLMEHSEDWAHIVVGDMELWMAEVWKSPREPDEALVERVAEALWAEHYGPDALSWIEAQQDNSSRMKVAETRREARAALQAVWR